MPEQTKKELNDLKEKITTAKNTNKPDEEECVVLEAGKITNKKIDTEEKESKCLILKFLKKLFNK